MDPSEQFVLLSAAKFKIEKELNQEIIEENISLLSSNVNYHYVDSMKDEDTVDDVID